MITVTRTWWKGTDGDSDYCRYVELSNGEVLKSSKNGSNFVDVVNERLAELNKPSAVYNDEVYTFAFSSVLFIERAKANDDRGWVVFNNSTWNTESEGWNNACWFGFGMQAVIDKYTAWAEAQ